MEASAEDQELREALREARDEGRLADAAQLARELGDHVLAGDLFSRAECAFEAAVSFRAAGLSPVAFTEALRVREQDERFEEAVCLAIELAQALGQVSDELHERLRPLLRRRALSDGAVQALWSLGRHYQRSGNDPCAEEIFEALLRHDPQHEAGMHLSAIRGDVHRVTLPSMRGVTISVSPGASPSASPSNTQSSEPARTSSVRWSLVPVDAGNMLASRYRIDRMLGEGGTAQVFRAHDTVLSEDVALKFLNAPFRDEKALTRFKRELSLARKLSHPNVMRVHDLAFHNEHPVITMELLLGKDLGTYVRKDRPSLEQLAGLLAQACDGLGYAHSQGIIHRDIKPENLFVTEDGVLKVADFGLAKSSLDPGITGSGTLAGTPYYMSPEQINDMRTVDPRSDLYSLGAMIYDLVTGEPPFMGDSLTKLLMQHLQAPVPSLRERRPDAPAALDSLVRRMMAKAPENRPEDCGEVAQVLRSLFEA